MHSLARSCSHCKPKLRMKYIEERRNFIAIQNLFSLIYVWYFCTYKTLSHLSFQELWPSRVLPKGIVLPNVIIKGLERHNFSIIIQNIITSNGVKEWSSPCRRRVSLLNLSPSNVCICAVRGRRRRGGVGVQCINLQ